MFVSSPRFYVEALSLSDGIRRWELWEVIRLRGGHEGAPHLPARSGASVFAKRKTEISVSFLCLHSKGRPGGGSSWDELGPSSLVSAFPALPSRTDRVLGHSCKKPREPEQDGKKLAGCLPAG